MYVTQRQHPSIYTLTIAQFIQMLVYGEHQLPKLQIPKLKKKKKKTKEADAKRQKCGVVDREEYEFV